MKVLLCGIAKNENHYLREWVEWYKDLGIDHICLYDNNDPDGERFEEVISDYINSGFVEVIDFRGKTMCQQESYNDCYQKYKKEYDWFCFLDLDELLYVDNLKEFLSEKKFDSFNGIKLCWKCMSDDNRLKVENGDYSMVKRFKTPVYIHSNMNLYTKTIIRGDLDIVYKSSVHFPDNIGRICDVFGRPQKACNKMKATIWYIAYILHYRCKTLEEYITNKMLRLYPDHTEELAKNMLDMNYFWKHNIRTPEKEEYARQLMEQYGYTLYSR